MIKTLNELLSVKKLNDKLWKIVVLKSYCSTLQAMLNEIFSSSNVNLNYDSTKSIISEMKNLVYNMTKTLCEYLFIKRVKRIIKES